MMSQCEHDNGDALMVDKDDENLKEKEKEKGKQLAEEENIIKHEEIPKIETNNEQTEVTNHSSPNSPRNDDMAMDESEEDESDEENNSTGDDQHFTLEALSELACQIDSAQKDKSASTSNNGHVAAHVMTHSDDNTPLPLWVKWRGKWQSGIRCPKEDCPSSTLKAKPTHEMKSYMAVFFPRSKAYCWINTLHSRPINEAPEPLKNGSHNKWRKLVRDLSITRSHALQKLALAMLSLTDQLHSRVVIEVARKGNTWKEFALEASACRNYSDLGNLLVKLRNMILSDYLNTDWLKTNFDSWVQKCGSAQSAESLEFLTDELVQNILWKRIEELWTGSTTQQEQTPEWKTLKQDVTKIFIASREEFKRPITNMFPNLETPQTSRKRPKLEVRRPGQDVNSAGKQVALSDPSDPLTTPTNKNGYTYRQCATFIESKGRQCERWANDGDVYCCVHLYASSANSDKRVGFGNPSDPLSTSKGYTYRQCGAFIEAKGRQCERWASDGDTYCSAHLNASNSSSDKRVGFVNPSDPLSMPSKSGFAYRQCAAYIEAKGRQCERWATSEGDIYCCIHLKSMSSANLDKRVGFVNPSDPLSTPPPQGTKGYTYRQCGAFIEAKGRQCERWANDGDAFCCVHLNVRVDPTERRAPLDSPMCRGTTTNGTNCKHRAKPGSSYCKKHRVDSVNPLNGVRMSSSSSPDIINFSDNSGVMKQSQSSQISFVPTPVPISVPVFFENKPDIHNHTNNNTNNNIAFYTPSSTPNSANISDLRCIGERANANEIFTQCQEYAKKYDLYCQNHIPKFLKRARDGRSRPITKEVILNLLKTCPSRKEKLLLHRACELLYTFLKCKLLVRKPKFDMSDKTDLVLTVANNDPEVCEYLVKLISHERDKLSSVWNLPTNNNNNYNKASSSNGNNNNNINNLQGVKCKFCLEEFSDDNALTLHWTKVHKKEARWLFRGYACKLCMEGFTNRKVLESHVIDKHGTSEFVQDSTLFRCISCNAHFPNPDPLWQHVLAIHVSEFRQVDTNNNNNTDLDNVNNNNNNNFTLRRGKYQLNRFKFKKTNGQSQTNLKISSKTYNNIANNTTNNNAMIVKEMVENENVGLGTLMDSDCVNVARVLFPEIRKSNPHPSNLEILSLAREACCRTSLCKKLEEKLGVLPENVFLKAAKLCSEADVRIEWFKEGFVCVNGCKCLMDPQPVLGPILLEDSMNEKGAQFERDEYYEVLDSRQLDELNWKSEVKEEKELGFVLLCEDLSFGKEKFTIPCFIDEEIRVSVQLQNEISMPWKDFTYVTQRLVNPPIDETTKDEELGCGCSSERCSADKCDHVYLFDNDYENAIDISSKPMHEKFAYDENGRIILQEGYPVYECNSSCKCDASCQNRVIQKGVRVKLQVFRTKSKGWGVRAGEKIPRGTFICEIIGEILNGDEASQRRDRLRKDGCSYLCEIEAHMGHARGMMSDETVPCVIDSFQYGNISRFINHSCSPNLSSYLVLIENMDVQLARVALFANRDIELGEELGYDYRYKMMDGGDGEKCYCGTHSCRGRLY